MCLSSAVTKLYASHVLDVGHTYTQKLFYVVGWNVWELDGLKLWDLHEKLEVACILSSSDLEKLICVCLSNCISLTEK